MSTKLFPAEGDPDCQHRSHYECMSCHKLVCARCSAELAASTSNWKTGVGYGCRECRDRKEDRP